MSRRLDMIINVAGTEETSPCCWQREGQGAGKNMVGVALHQVVAGKPMQGQTHSDEKGRLGKRDLGREGGLAGVGASGVRVVGTGASVVGSSAQGLMRGRI